MKTNSDLASTPFPAVTEEDVRDYAYHLYVQSGCQSGRDLDNWLEAKACLGECIPPAQSHVRLHRHTQRNAAPPASVTKISAA